MTADETNLAMELLRRIDINLDLMRLEMRGLAACVTRCASALDRINDRLDGFNSRLERIDNRLALSLPSF